METALPPIIIPMWLTGTPFFFILAQSSQNELE
jgi:hypothetical protein